MDLCTDSLPPQPPAHPEVTKPHSTDELDRSNAVIDDFGSGVDVQDPSGYSVSDMVQKD